MPFVLTRRFLAHRYWAATLVTLLSLAGVLVAGLLHLQARATDARYAAAFVDLVPATRELEIAFLASEPNRNEAGDFQSGDYRARLADAVRRLGTVVGAIRASDRDGVYSEEDNEVHQDELDRWLNPEAAALAAEYGLEHGRMPKHLAEIWEADAKDGEPSMRLERHIGELLRLAGDFLESGETAPPSDALVERFRQVDSAMVEPALSAIRKTLHRHELAEVQRARVMLLATSCFFAAVALGNVFLIFRPMERAVLADRAAVKAERNRAVRSEQAKRDFLAVMSHELRTPMNGVLGFAALLLQSNLNETQRDQAATIVQSGKHLLDVLNSILDISKIESGSYELDPAPVALADTVDAILKLLGPHADEKRLELSAFVDPALPSHVVTDEAALRKILLNLVGNAVKFTPSGAVAVELHRIDDATDDAIGIEIDVIDTGIGIAADKLARIFERFAQVDSSASRPFEGTGLGLTICRELAHMMGGNITVDSTPDRGSCFRVRIRVEPTEPPAEPIASTIGEGLSDKRILVVDDNDLNRRIARLQLESCGASVTLAGNAQAAIREVSEAIAGGRPFHLFIIDHMMPEADGVSLLEMLRRLRDATPVPAILSSSGGVTTSAAGARLGFDAAVPKPMTQALLLETASRLVAGAGSTARKAAPEPPDVPQPVDGERRWLLVADDDPINQRLARRVLELAGFCVDFAANGAEVLQAARGRAYDLVLMDIRMPTMDGFEAARQLRELGNQRPGLPVLAVSANAMPEDHVRYTEAGFAGFVDKPYAPADLVAAVRRHLPPRDRAA